jgi:hypothetical protein
MPPRPAAGAAFGVFRSVTALTRACLVGCAVAPAGADPEPVAAPTPLSLSSPCVEVPRREYLVEVVGREANPRPDHEEATPVMHQFASVPLELDGDGVLDRAVPSLVPGDCPHQVVYTLYVLRGACGHEVGSVVGFPEVAGSDPGMRPLRSTRSWAVITDPARAPGPTNVATHHEVVATWSASDGRYVEGPSETRSGICHHCAISRCRITAGP